MHYNYIFLSAMSVFALNKKFRGLVPWVFSFSDWTGWRRLAWVFKYYLILDFFFFFKARSLFFWIHFSCSVEMNAFCLFRSLSSETMSSLKKGCLKLLQYNDLHKESIGWRASLPFVTSSYKWNLGQASEVSEIRLWD